ncbi:hypothetical protein TBLA_0A04330 [Henningerozyma blattae CBS 6284]|uniref:Rab proteins geranylgeranyltransferase component A n=1 Tax=Henningerozyma blattae (strain ATCC 34711 / CBS 6284 / DSM 70876 / NBRC 10599 / NRRL Y-10934 / UCD 77-7) TaxID=1071380 RepID=I2GVS6_HENB6|nr:hypothetical protein TBLA_0A04330 [Tetrapisispora blattae CBS 6284]CCH58228.1 hypothetical protein TBLA_0A04330 [Tetrapisispora blattae CBS 6284]
MKSFERRPSVAERRSPFVGSASTNNTPTPMVVPHLAGIEDPVPETTPEKVDVLIAGTGIVESVLAAALAWQGSNVLHIDQNDHYGDTSATLTVDQIKRWVNEVNSGKLAPYSNAKLYVSTNVGRNYKSRDFGVDLSPKLLFANSDLLSILVKSRVHQYLEFQSLSSFHTFENDSFEKLTNSKQEIFTDNNLPLMTKRNLMRFIKFVLNWEAQPEIWEAYSERSIYDFLTEKFKLDKAQTFELIFSIGLCYNIETVTPKALQRIRRYLTSFDVYGPFPVMYSKYGGSGEVSQGFCRSAAVGGATYKLNDKLIDYNPETKIATFKDGSKVTVMEKVIMSPTQAPEGCANIPKQQFEIHRLICIVEKTCNQWFADGESAAVVVFPPGSLKSNNTQVVQAVIQGSNSETCPRGTSIWYLTSAEQGPRGEIDLDAALEALENSLLRETSQDIVNDSDIVQVGPEGQTIINSVKLGQSFKEYVPREKLNFLMKFYFTQHTSTPPFNIVASSLFDMQDDNRLIPGASDNGIIYTPMPSAEISYDEVVTAAKVLYEKIVGSDDDFFDVDFEDEDDNAMTNNPDYENAIASNSDEDIAMGDSGEPVGEMEI